MRRIGWLSGTEGARPTFYEALRELGWIEGRNLAFEARNAEGRRERTVPLAKELVDARVDLVVAVAPTAIRANQAARQVDKILRGARPGDLPVAQPTKFELAVKLATAKALGLTLPRSVQVQADQIIE